MSRLVLSLLGSFQATSDGAPVTTFESDKVRALLVYLAVEHSRPQRREMLAGLLWPDMPERDARANLRHVLANLRKVIGDRDADQPFLLAGRQMLQFNVDSDYQLDVRTFADAIAATIAHPHTKLEDCEPCIARLRKAAALYNGEFLTGFSLDSDLFEAWITAWREKLHIQVLDVLDHLATYHEQRSDYAEVIRYAQRQVHLEPWRESAHRQWMRALACSGQCGMALAQYDACRRILETELGIEPEAATTALYENIRRGELQPPARSSPDIQPTPVPIVAPVPQPQVPISSIPALAPEGERRVVTLLLADVRSAAASVQLDTEAWAELITPALHLLGADVNRLGGSVEQYRRFGLMACFGGQVAHEDDPERAVIAALAMREALAAYLAQSNAVDLNLTVSVHTGEVIRTPIGDTMSMMGSVLDDAERVHADLAPGAIWVSKETHHLIAPQFTWDALGSSGYEPLVYRPQIDKGRGIAGLSSPLVGRDAELRALQEAVEHLRAGIGGIVTLVGEAGIGKSRLVAELHKSTHLQSPNLQWIEGRCFSYATGSAYHVWRDMLHVWLNVAPGVASNAMVTTLRERVRAVCPEAFDDVYPFIAQVLSLPLDDTAAARLRGIDAQGMQVLTFRAVETLLDCAAQRIPLVLVCEDLHWADATSLALLEHLLPLTDRVPLLFVCIFRPEREQGCWRIRELAARQFYHRYTGVWLRPLSTEEAGTLVSHLLYIEELADNVRQWILTRAEGNPFYVEELIRALIANGSIVHDAASSRWQATTDNIEVTLPTTLHGVLRTRIDRLAPETRRVLHIAAVIGRVFSQQVLAEVARGILPMEPHLLTLQQEQLIRERARLPEVTYIFKHQLTQEAAYASLLRRRRRALHKRVAEALERLYPERIEEQLGLLAHHWEQAEETEQAIPYLQRAGEQAMARYAPAEALAYVNRALALLPQEPVSSNEGQMLKRYALFLLREKIHRLQGVQEAWQQDLATLKALAEALDDQKRESTRRLAEVAAREAEYATWFWYSDLDLAIASAAADRAAHLAQVAHDTVLEATSYVMWGFLVGIRLGLGATARTEVVPKLQRALTQARAVHCRDVEIEALIMLGIVYKFSWNITVAWEYFEQALHLCDEIDARAQEGRVFRELGDILFRQGDNAGAQRYAEQSLRICRETGNQLHEELARSLLSDVADVQGDYVKALAYSEQALTTFRKVKYRYGEGLALRQMGRACRKLGDYASAKIHYESALQLHNIYDPYILTLAELGISCLEQGDDKTAREHLQHAIRMMQDSRRPDQWAMWVALGHALIRQGNLVKAAEAFQQALALEREVNLERKFGDAFVGLAHVALLQEDRGQALAYVEDILDCMETLNDPFRAYLICYRVLRANDDARAVQVLHEAYVMLQTQAAKIEDEALRRSYLRNVPYHREIVAEFDKTHYR